MRNTFLKIKLAALMAVKNTREVKGKDVYIKEKIFGTAKAGQRLHR